MNVASTPSRIRLAIALISSVVAVSAILIGIVGFAPMQRVLNIQTSNQQSICDAARLWKTQVGTQTLTIMPARQESALSTMYPGRDLEYLPIYPGADEPNTESNDLNERYNNSTRRYFTYYPPASVSIDQLVDFYREALPDNGWSPVWHGIPDGPFKSNPANTYPVYYTWTDLQGLTPVHFYLNMILGITEIDRTHRRTYVYMEYGRYADIESMPVYTGTTTVQRQCIYQPQPVDPHGDSKPHTIITTTYVTTASPDEVADFYNSVLPTFGWTPISSAEGLQFRSRGGYNDKLPDLGGLYSLNITTATGEGMTGVTLQTGVSHGDPAYATDQRVPR
ncbi:MAG: hypothetical protein ABI670_09455 [Chloroflexota bacterium]